MNPFTFPRNRELRAECGDDACPLTLEILRRTVHVPVDPDWAADGLAAKADALVRAVERVPRAS